MTDRRAEEMPLLVRHLQEPARPTARIAAGVPVGQIANDGQCLGARGRSIGQLDPLLVRHLAATEGKMEKIARHGPSSLVHAQTAEEPLCSAGETRIPRLRVSVEILTTPRIPGRDGSAMHPTFRPIAPRRPNDLQLGTTLGPAQDTETRSRFMVALVTDRSRVLYQGA